MLIKLYTKRKKKKKDAGRKLWFKNHSKVSKDVYWDRHLKCDGLTSNTTHQKTTKPKAPCLKGLKLTFNLKMYKNYTELGICNLLISCKISWHFRLFFFVSQ